MITLPAGKPFNIETPSNSFKLNGETKSNGIYTTVVQSIVTFDDDQDSYFIHKFKQININENKFCNRTFQPLCWKMD